MTKSAMLKWLRSKLSDAKSELDYRENPRGPLGLHCSPATIARFKADVDALEAVIAKIQECPSWRRERGDDEGQKPPQETETLVRGT